MKNSYIALAVFSMAALLVSSCETANEIQDNIYIPGENEIVFTMAHNQIQTKASYDESSVAKIATMELGKQGDNNFFLDESVVDLNGAYSGPETKGTPAYTENLGVLYKGKLGVYGDGGNFGTSEITYGQVGDAKVGNGWQYRHKYNSDPWPDEDGAVGLYFRMPNDMSGVTVSSRANGRFTFTYTSPTSSTAQQDILFGYRTATKSQHEAAIENGGLPVLLKHALTGVKFAVGNPEDVTINSIKIEGLYNTGTCIIAPTAENEDYTDDITDHSSKDDIVSWTPTTSSTGTFTNTYDGIVNFGVSTSTEEGVLTSFGDNGKYPDSFAQTGGKNNLNNATASQTFWFIPQDFGTAASPRDVTLTVTYSLNGSSSSEAPLVINFGELLAKRGIEWEAGQLYTYTLRIDEVNVRIEDTVTAGTGGVILGSTKSAVKITNTGNTDVFIRAAIVGQWVVDQKTTGNNNEKVIVFGFTDEVNHLYLVDSWYQDQFGPNASGDHGLFVGLAGYQADPDGTNNHPASYNGWVYKDGYYYCTTPVAPNADTPTPLFDSYTIKYVPHTTDGGLNLSDKMYFTLEIATQAISARTDNGTLLEEEGDWELAWSKALALDDTAVVHNNTTTGNNENGE